MIVNYAMALTLFLLLTGCTSTTIRKSSTEPALQSDLEKSSYAQGVQYMENLRQYGISLAQEQFLLGLNDVSTKKTIRMTPEQLKKGQVWVILQQADYMDKIAIKNLAEGKAFLEANQQKPSVVALHSGLQYKIVSESKGKRKATLKDTVSVRYRIGRINGEEIAESGKDIMAPSEIQVKNVIKGWQEALLMMPVGSKWELFIPSALAYGETGAPEGGIQPNETIIFDLELVDIKPAKDLAKTADSPLSDSFPAQIELIK